MLNAIPTKNYDAYNESVEKSIEELAKSGFVDKAQAIGAFLLSASNILTKDLTPEEKKHVASQLGKAANRL